ncbi:Sas10/Utp3/C1D family-domain-containing protein [Phyllosticta citribraziliensis]|uniref:Exosome complex protein n=1 Tax=Phyllosticta citribraziliensis TaxID=989973 RepID=A0ABR1LTV6_9PEZI
MDSVDLKPLIEDLEDNIDDLEETLEPLLKDALSANASKLPLLDKAKLYVLVTYAIESVLFSHLSLAGVKAKEHPVFTEISRVRQYFQKIKEVESGPAKPTQRLDVPAANRFINAGLAGNDKFDKEREMQQAKERAMARLKADQLSKKRKAAETGGSGAEAQNDQQQQEDSPQVKKSRRSKAADLWEEGTPKDQGKKKGRAEDTSDQTDENVEDAEEGEADDGGEEEARELAVRKKKSSRVPLGHKEAFKQLLQGPISKPEEPAKKKTKSRSKKKAKA